MVSIMEVIITFFIPRNEISLKNTFIILRSVLTK